jgi:hypothetical protein
MMRKSFLFFLLFILCSVMNAQYNIRDKYEDRYHEYNRMKIKGIVFLSIGAATDAGAAALFIKGNEIQNTDPLNENNADGYYIGGGLLGAFSALFLLPDTIYTSIGAVKSREYKKLMRNLSVNPVYTPNIQGISMATGFDDP